jgi:cytidine deaminase
MLRAANRTLTDASAIAIFEVATPVCRSHFFRRPIGSLSSMRTIRAGGQKWSLFTESELNPRDRTLIRSARKAAENASPRFSQFRVGAAVRIKGSKDPICGWNVEDQSLAAVLHAEQAALNAAIHLRQDSVKVLTIAIWGHGDVPPCGRCRQMIVDSNPDARVLFPYSDGILVATATDLLPLGFRLLGAP